MRMEWFGALGYKEGEAVWLEDGWILERNLRHLLNLSDETWYNLFVSNRCSRINKSRIVNGIFNVQLVDAIYKLED